jgi:hypothetical protein
VHYIIDEELLRAERLMAFVEALRGRVATG